MKKIVGILRPFDLTQSFYVYEDGNKIEVVYPKVSEINSTIIGLIDKYQIEQIDLTGPKQYAKGICKQLREDIVLKYNNNSNITINLI